MKIYRGFRMQLQFANEPSGAWIPQVIVEDTDRGTTYLLPLRLDLHNHSPTGVEWGYAGSGPAQLALALCADAIQDDQRALELYEEFKWKCVRTLPWEGWVLWETDVLLMCTVLRWQQR